MFRLAMATLLQRSLGFDRVAEALSLDDALAQLGGDHPFALAIFDLDMPGMIDAASLMAVRECFPDVRVMVVTASMQRRDVLRALEAGVHGFVSKGLGIEIISQAIEAVVRGAIYVPTWIAEPPAVDAQPLLRAEPSTTSDREAPKPAATLRSVANRALTQRQGEVLNLVSQGKSNKEIARSLSLTESTIKVHVAALLRAYNVSSRSALAAASVRRTASV